MRQRQRLTERLCRLEAGLLVRSRAREEGAEGLTPREAQVMADVALREVLLTAELDRAHEEERERWAARERERVAEREVLARVKASSEADVRHLLAQQVFVRESLCERHAACTRVP